MTEPAAAKGAVVRCVPALPSWVSLTVSDLDGAMAFYGELLGWTFSRGPDRWGPYVRALAGGVAVAGMSASELYLPVAWTTFFGTEDADAVSERIQARGGTVAIGPLGFDAGRMLIASDRSGAPFGVWEGDTTTGAVLSSLAGGPVWIELRTKDAFDSALYYGEVFGWDDRKSGVFDVRWEHERVVLRSTERSVAALVTATDPEARPSWNVYFSVADADESAELAERLGADVLGEVKDSPYGRWADLRDPQGGRFCVQGPRPEDD
ncbi:VOC family protein [Kitasatospora sp. RB6PN24]|uniref:VOC family protein n=1 Tax=Kitasatospora humi TaxID=2893891 RepID=UPI001E653A63|nr:VOC family protein [Kitasatospora humi]MCC9308883.1 VOC family protein [Kitasatospora humi]